MKKIINNKNILNIFFILLSVTAFIFYEQNGYSNIITIFVTIFLAYFYFNTNIKIDKKARDYSLILSIIISLILGIGNITNNSLFQDKIFTLINLAKLVCIIIGFIPFLYRLFLITFNKLNKFELKSKVPAKIKWWQSFIIIFVCYLPYYIIYFPGKLSLDSYNQLSQIQNNSYNDWHPYIHTKFVSLFYNIGEKLFGTENAGIGLYIFVQVILMALLLSFIINYLKKQNLNKWIIYITLAAFVLLPCFTFYSITLWKDIVFAFGFPLICISLLEFEKDNYSASNIIIFILSLIIITFFRNNGIFITIFITPFIIFSQRKYIKILLPILLIIIGSFFLLKGPIYKKLNVGSTSIKEGLSVPLQQMARVIANNSNIDKESKEYLENLYEYDKISDSYETYISDPIKSIANALVIENDIPKFIKVWFKLLLKNPIIYIEAYLSQTAGYYYPDTSYWVVLDNEVDIYNLNARQILNLTTKKAVPLSNIWWSTGLPFVLCLISFIISKYKKQKNGLAYVAFLGLWLSLMLFTPVYAEYRYMYGMILSYPLIIMLPFISSKN